MTIGEQIELMGPVNAALMALLLLVLCFAVTMMVMDVVGIIDVPEIEVDKLECTCYTAR